MSSANAPHQTVRGLLFVQRSGVCHLYNANGGHIKAPPGPKSGGSFLNSNESLMTDPQ